MKLLKKVALTSVFLLITIAVITWLGLFNVSATDKHWATTTYLLGLVRDRSVAQRASDIQAPDITSVVLVKEGAPNYSAMCAQCHLSPGETSSELFEGLNPQPPNFSLADHKPHNPAETFWIIKNGIKMTGMPAWGESHTEQQIWDLVAFVNALDTMSAEDYKTLVGDGKHTHAGGGHGDMGHHDQLKTSDDAPVKHNTGYHEQSITSDKAPSEKNTGHHDHGGHSH